MTCPICLETLSDELCTLKCGHSYHKKCIDQWCIENDHQTCPVCRKEITVEVVLSKSCWIDCFVTSFVLMFAVGLVVLVYYFVNAELYKPYRVCRNNLINTDVIGTVKALPDASTVIFSYLDRECTIKSRLRFALNETVTLYVSNVGYCALEQEQDNCNRNIVAFNVVFTLLGGPFLVGAIGCWVCLGLMSTIEKIFCCPETRIQ